MNVQALEREPLTDDDVFLTGLGKDNCHASSLASPPSTEGWVGHPLDPIGCLFDTLLEASLAPKSQTPTPSSSSSSSEENKVLPYHHVVVPSSEDRQESYLTLALEVALVGR